MTPSELMEHAQAARFRPAEKPEDVFGELRSLAHHGFDGGEVWEDWEPLFQAVSDGDRERLVEYFANHWHTEEVFGEPLDAIRSAFVFRVALAHYKACAAEAQDGILYPLGDKRYEVDWYFEPPASEADILALKAKLGVALPRQLATFAREVSAGIDSDAEQLWFFISGDEDAYLPTTFSAFDLESCGVDDEYTDGASTREGRFALLSWALGKIIDPSSKQTSVKIPDDFYEQVQQDPSSHTSAPIEHIERAVVLDCYFEGNHGDDVTFWIQEGPLAGRFVTWNLYGHSMGTRGTIHSSPRFCFGDYLLEWLENFE